MLSTSQLAALAGASAEHSDGSLELTSRGNVQLRGIAAGAEVALAAALEAAGLLPSPDHERVRNIIASVLSGRSGGLVDVRPLVAALDRGLCADPLLAELPGRFLFTLDDGRGDVSPLGADITLAATATPAVNAVAGGGPAGEVVAGGRPAANTVAGGRPAGEVVAGGRPAANTVAGGRPAGEVVAGGGAAAGAGVFALILAGADTGLRCSPDDGPALALAAARAFLAERAAQGSAAWRIAELTDGPARVAARLADPSGANRTVRTPVPSPDTEHPDNPDSCGTAGSAPAAAAWPVGVVPQRDGLAAVAAVVPLGRLTAAQVTALATAGPNRALRPAGPAPGGPNAAATAGPDPTPAGNAAATAGPDHTSEGDVLVTPWRTVVVTDLAPGDVDETVARLRSVGLVTDPASPWVGVTTCAGQPGCAKALADVRSDAANTRTEPGKPVHWIGCERACGRPKADHVEVLATPDGYLVDGLPVSDQPAAGHETPGHPADRRRNDGHGPEGRRAATVTTASSA